ncbi:hypothetical protein WICPIJ_010132 [Wickerhamomyces pijperi]|uniref:tRNA:m(4)X modification enzyme TRM13 n=1 Tax=Wickerhamomyces pijperi TaxID=599730 RepID=A0A9P8TA81_WICPI|nr:hypothetical protein WICPIJ_010132 [Wickerhamomyces pijperi]
MTEESNTELQAQQQTRKKAKKVKSQTQRTERLQCEFLLPKKNKKCPLTRKATEQYCAEHLRVNSATQKKLPCPVKGCKHEIWESELKNHVKVCEIKQRKLESVPWFKENYNCDNGFKSQISDADVDLDYAKWIKLVEDIYGSKFNGEDLPLVQLDHEGTKDRMDELTNQKHIIQQSSLISHLDTRGLLSSDLNYIEFGCGRAELSRYFLKCIMFKDAKPSDFLLIDRSPSRLKLDSKMVKDVQLQSDLKQENRQNKVHRVKIDIKDLYIDNIITEQFQSKKFVAISKHLCGAATDLTLQCLLNSKQLNEGQRFGGMIVAMCCRHCCDYTMLHSLSREYLSDLGIDETGFKHLKKFASWAVNGRRPGMLDTDGADHASGLCLKDREVLGLKARRIIDESRKFALESSELGVEVELCKYVSSDISLENTALIVTRKV